MRWLSNPWDGGEGYKVDQYTYLRDREWYESAAYKQAVAARRRDMAAVRAGRVEDEGGGDGNINNTNTE